jgi:hypothetical protein
VLELRCELNFAVKPFLINARRHVGGQDLDHDLPAEFDLLREEDAAHSATAEFFLDAVGVADGFL